MADPKDTPAEPGTTPVGGAKWTKYVQYAVWAAVTIAAVGTFILQWQRDGKPGPLPDLPPLPQVEQPAPAVQTSDGQVYSFGWANDAEARDASLKRMPSVLFSTTPAGRTAMGDVSDVFLWRAVRKAAGQRETAGWYPNVDQKLVGCCVGCAWKHGADVCQAVPIADGKGGEFHPVSVEVIYGGSRVEVGGGRLRGDGSVGAWAREYVSSRGVAAMQKYPSADLTTFSPERARTFGARGVPADIETAAKEHPVKGTAQVSSWVDVQRAIKQGYPVAVCSDQGFAGADGQSPGTRDKDGFCAPRGTWPHAMCIIGVRGGNRPGGFILNSWGDTAHRGPVWPADAPPAGFWADADVIDRMVRQGDSFALADLQGFPSRQLDWFAEAPPAAPGRCVALGRRSMPEVFIGPAPSNRDLQDLGIALAP